MIQSSGIEKKFTATGKISGYQVNLYHTVLKEHKYLSSPDYTALEGKIKNQELTWAVRSQKANEQKRWLSDEDRARDETKEAQLKLTALENILSHTLSVNDALDWESLKDNTPFFWKQQAHQFINFRKADGYPNTVEYLKLIPMPDKIEYMKEIRFLDKILGKTKKIKEQQNLNYNAALKDWENSNNKISNENETRNTELKSKQNYWQKDKDDFTRFQTENNNDVDLLRSRYEAKEIEAILEYIETVLRNSHYPENFPKQFDLQYNDTNGMILVDYELPSLSKIPTLNNVRYIKSRREFEEKHIPHSTREKLYDSIIYQIILRTIHEIFEADVNACIQSVNLNGIVKGVNPASGHIETSCIASLQAKRDEFEKINLASVDPKQCFKSLKGVGGSKLSSMAAIKPILELDKSDRRFKDHYDVASGLNEEINLASMDWEDFEHLVRELFASEFSVNGGEVRVTQASIDGGVDAVAFDPDPIRGGKIVIQAKRYTNVVGVSAVRDLYGTMMNEGAMKGILVTTSDYGSDSYEFAKGKPITLLNGSNLLHLLERHGHRAKIDIKEAKKSMKAKS